MRTLQNVTTQDQYVAGNTVEAAEIVRFVISVTGAVVKYQLAHGWPPNYDTPEAVLPPGVAYTLERACSGIRLKSFAPGKPAQVSLEAVEPIDLPAGA